MPLDICEEGLVIIIATSVLLFAVAIALGAYLIISCPHPKPSFVEYVLTGDPIDVVIPTIQKDSETLEECVKGIKRHGRNVRRVIVVSDRKYTDHAEWFDEKLYPFSKNDVAFFLCQNDPKMTRKYMKSPKCRAGWYFQQLVKLYAPFVIPGISPNVLVLDSDTIFLRDVSFLNHSNEGFLNIGGEYHKEYFRHADALTGGFIKRVDSKISGVTHHMLFQKPILEDLFRLVEEIHGVEFWKAFCHFADYKQTSGASEYEIYFNFAISRTHQVKMHQLFWCDISNLDFVKEYENAGYHYVSCHSWQRRKK